VGLSAASLELDSVAIRMRPVVGPIDARLSDITVLAPDVELHIRKPDIGLTVEDR
jgi:hypothetical protein